MIGRGRKWRRASEWPCRTAKLLLKRSTVFAAARNPAGPKLLVPPNDRAAPSEPGVLLKEPKCAAYRESSNETTIHRTVPMALLYVVHRLRGFVRLGPTR